MELDTSTIMMEFFIILLVLSIWKIYAFLPNKQLEDDDSTEDAQDNINKVLLLVIIEHHGKLNVDELLIKMQEHKDFDNQKHWRFNKNKLNQLLNNYYLTHSDTHNIKDIYRNITKTSLVV